VKLSIIMSVYNERETLREILSQVRSVDLGGIEKEIVAVDDGSTDGSRDILAEEAAAGDLKAFYHDVNQGKGAGIRTGIEHASGDIILIQDADLEYDPADYPKLVQPLLDGKADVVYGSRFAGGEPHRVLYFWHYVGNRFLTLLSNMCTNLNLTDMETCYKVFRVEVIRNLKLRCNRFGFEPEVTAKVARGRWRIYEVGISYSGRSYEEGKKITWRDGVRAIFCIIRFALAD